MVGAPPGPPEVRIDGGEARQARRPDTYRSALAMLVWWVWFAFAVANLIDIAVQGRDHVSVTAAAALLLVTGIMYVAAFRPRVIATDGGIVVRNPLRDHRVPWPAVTNVDLCELLRVHCAWQEPAARGRQAVPRPERVQRTRVIHAWAVQSPRRAAEMGMRSSFGRPDLARRSVGGAAATADPPSAVHRKETERIARALAERARRERADAARPRVAAGETGQTGENRAPENGAGGNGRAGTGAGNGPGWPSHPVSAWHWPGVLAAVVPALLLVAAILA
jgi:Bacterial PH domain